MAWPQWSGETSGTDGRVDGTDWNSARNFNAVWTDEALSASAITVDGDGKFRVTYSGAQNLDDINGTSDGDVVIIRADVTGAGGNLTIRNNGGGSGNIRTTAAVDIVLTTNGDWCLFCNNEGVLYGGMIYGA